MKQITCVFFGLSGSGKGTQAQLLLKYLGENDSKRKTLYVETGQRFRDLQKNQNYTATKVKEVTTAGKFLPPFLPIWNWTGFLIEHFSGRENLIFDGVCRQPEEVPVFDSALQFYGVEKPTVILLKTERSEIKDRLLKRGRYDDTDEKIDERVRAFESGAMPAIEYFKKAPTCNFVVVNGDQTIPEVFEDVKKALGL
jgi:adenylate kinase family enzyme